MFLFSAAPTTPTASATPSTDAVIPPDSGARGSSGLSEEAMWGIIAACIAVAVIVIVIVIICCCCKKKNSNPKSNYHNNNSQ